VAPPVSTKLAKIVVDAHEGMICWIHRFGFRSGCCQIRVFLSFVRFQSRKPEFHGAGCQRVLLPPIDIIAKWCSTHNGKAVCYLTSGVETCFFPRRTESGCFFLARRHSRHRDLSSFFPGVWICNAHSLHFYCWTVAVGLWHFCALLKKSRFVENVEVGTVSRQYL